ncbi:hypothetical protein C5167_034688 [Papaver somniferum]|uniref:Uncharacterized protein n=1 Tax=Papaver somniferum TaxID=3469 RepID=A0A4Y7KDP9_PAPSO|nr:hypothetical protein C5167_034688 [Papaver somniferum]
MTREIRVGPEQTREGRLQGVTCLPFKESGEEIELKGVSHLKKKHFEGADALRNPILSGKSKKRPRKLRNREHVPCSSDERHKIDDQDWLSVENIEHFNKIPWGEKSYVLCFENTKKAIKYQNNKEDPTAKLSLKPRGLPQALVVWMLKLFPHLLEKYGSESRTKGQRPLILTVWCGEEIRAGGEAFRDAAWEEAVSENHDLEDA